MKGILRLAVGLLMFPGLGSVAFANGHKAASCPQYSDSWESYMEKYRTLTSVADVDRCLNSIEKLEEWKSAWEVDSGFANKVLNYGIKANGQMGVGLSLDLMGRSSTDKLFVHSETLRRQGLVMLVRNGRRPDNITDYVESAAKPEKTFNLSEFRDRLLFARELAAAVALEIADERLAIGALKPDIESGKLSRQEVQAVNGRIDQLDNRREVLKRFNELLGALSSQTGALDRVEEKLRALVLQKMRERNLGADAIRWPLLEAGSINFDGGRSW